jgi:transposase
MNPEVRKEIEELAARPMAIRAIARKLGIDPKTVRRALGRAPGGSQAPKLEPFKEEAARLAAKGLKGPRILREIRAKGYKGSRTILGEYLRTIRPESKPAGKAVRRFETARGREAQMDWSPYQVPIGGVVTTAQCFSMIVCWSRRLFIAFYRDERLPTLLHGHVEAFAYHHGLCEVLVYDNQTTVTLGRLHGKPLWNPAFLDFTRHYGFEPWACRPRHKERKGKVERPFSYIEDDFLKDRTFSSWEDLNAQARVWLDTVANVRTHGTTHKKVDEAWAEEKPYLIALPAAPFPTDRREVRKVATDATVAVEGSFYPVPPSLIGRHVPVRVYPDHVEVTDEAGTVLASHKVPDRPGRVPSPAAAPAPRAPESLTALEARFLARFPASREFLDGLKRRMTALTPIHLRKVERLVQTWGDDRVRAAIERAQAYGNFNAQALARILDRAHPAVLPDPIPAADPAALGALDDVDSGSLKDSSIDSIPPTAANQGDDSDADDRSAR